MRRIAALLSLSALLLTSCSRAGISGAGMMRVEVEVYKGPVGQTAQIQVGELSALLAETVKAVNGWRAQAVRMADSGPVSDRAAQPLGCSLETADPDCAVLLQAISAAAEVGASICAMAKEAPGYKVNTYVRRTVGGVELRNGCSEFQGQPTTKQLTLADTKIDAQPSEKELSLGIPEYTRRISTIASTMRIKAFRLVGASAGYVPRSRQVRYLTTSLGYLLSEFANSIASRNTVLQRTFPKCESDEPPCDTSDAAKLATGDYLRDNETTRFLDAYRWMNADIPKGTTGAYKRDDRIAAVQSLTDNYYWEKVNEVYASGQGDVSMAFIKDELGNWNLKSYTNDPSKLLAAYRQGANALIASAVDLARKAGGDPLAIAKGTRMLDLADRFATGKSSGASNVGGIDVTTLHQRTSERLLSLQKAFANRKETLGASKSAIELRIATATASAAADDAAMAASAAEDATARAALSTCTGSCETPAARLAQALTALQSARAAAGASASALRREQDALVRETAQLDQLGSVAAEEAARVLEEHQRDLNTVQASVVGAKPGLPATDVK